MFSRTLTDSILNAVKSFYAVSVVGPRQSGKTTLLKHLFPDYTYLNLEYPDILDMVKSDPRGFFRDKNKKWIIDEAQECPELFSYLLGFIDENKIKGQFILSGSQNFLLLERISQSLAGRVAVLELLPLTYSELQTKIDVSTDDVWKLIYSGSYPGPYNEKIDTDLWYKSYVTTYLQRDVRQLINVKDLAKFHLFLKLCAARHGQLLNLSEIGAACGVTHTTIAEWINLLEVSYLVFKLQPYYRNFNKRLVKSPKLFFYDSGIVCHLLGIQSPEEVQFHALRGVLFEGFIISEIAKYYFGRGKKPNMYFWNANNELEIDLIIEKANRLEAIEIKSSATFNRSFLKQLDNWKKIVKDDIATSTYLVYSGDASLEIETTKVIGFSDLELLV